MLNPEEPLQLTPRYQFLLPPEERGVLVSYEVSSEMDREFLRGVEFTDFGVDIQTTARTYRLDVSEVDPEDRSAAREILRRMQQHAEFLLNLQ